MRYKNRPWFIHMLIARTICGLGAIISLWFFGYSFFAPGTVTATPSRGPGFGILLDQGDLIQAVKPTVSVNYLVEASLSDHFNVTMGKAGQPDGVESVTVLVDSVESDRSWFCSPIVSSISGESIGMIPMREYGVLVNKSAFDETIVEAATLAIPWSRGKWRVSVTFRVSDIDVSEVLLMQPQAIDRSGNIISHLAKPALAGIECSRPGGTELVEAWQPESPDVSKIIRWQAEHEPFPIEGQTSRNVQTPGVTAFVLGSQLFGAPCYKVHHPGSWNYIGLLDWESEFRTGEIQSGECDIYAPDTRLQDTVSIRGKVWAFEDQTAVLERSLRLAVWGVFIGIFLAPFIGLFFSPSTQGTPRRVPLRPARSSRTRSDKWPESTVRSDSR